MLYIYICYICYKEHVLPLLTASTASARPMSTRNFPASFWNSAYQPPPPQKHLTSAYGASDFYGGVDYSGMTGLHHHHHPQQLYW